VTNFGDFTVLSRPCEQDLWTCCKKWKMYVNYFKRQILPELSFNVHEKFVERGPCCDTEFFECLDCISEVPEEDLEYVQPSMSIGHSLMPWNNRLAAISRDFPDMCFVCLSDKKYSPRERRLFQRTAAEGGEVEWCEDCLDSVRYFFDLGSGFESTTDFARVDFDWCFAEENGCNRGRFFAIVDDDFFDNWDEGWWVHTMIRRVQTHLKMMIWRENLTSDEPMVLADIFPLVELPISSVDE